MFDIKKTLEKGLRGAISGAIIAVVALFAKNGVSVGEEAISGLTVGLTGLALALLAMLTNFLKHRWPRFFGWL